jgi:5'-nucleotidase
MVTNDDGVKAEGMDAIVQGLLTLENVVVTVIAPAENASGSGGRTTDGPLTFEDTTTLSGYPAIAVNGFPADTVIWAVDQGNLKVVPDLVVSGVNEGQNIGPLVDLSGTVGAARAAAQRNIPAIAVSAGLTVNDVPENYPAAVEAALTWLRDNVADVAGHVEGDPVDFVISINTPTCITGGEVRGLLEVPLTMDIGDLDIVSGVDCNSTKPAEDIANDVDAFVNGFVAVAETPIAPAG